MMNRKQIVYTPGVFDLFHIGHLNVIRRAKLTGDYLIVGICSDALVKETKASILVTRDYERAEIVRELKCVDEVIIYDKMDQTGMIKKLNIDIFVVGEEFGNCKEHQDSLIYCQNNAISVVRIKRTPEISSSDIKNKLKP
jgi:glycerol-3-phosphate cytidylyltransferase